MKALLAFAAGWIAFYLADQALYNGHLSQASTETRCSPARNCARFFRSMFAIPRGWGRFFGDATTVTKPLPDIAWFWRYRLCDSHSLSLKLERWKNDVQHHDSECSRLERLSSTAPRSIARFAIFLILEPGSTSRARAASPTRSR